MKLVHVPYKGTALSIADLFNKLLATPEFRERLAALGAEPVGDPGRFAAHVRAETAKWAKVIADAGVKAD